jgi:hypothetical protein
MSMTIAMKEYKVISEFNWENENNFSKRFFQIIQASLNRTEAAKAFFNLGAQNAVDSNSKAFLQQLESKKDLHCRIIEKIGRNSEILPFPMITGKPEYKDTAQHYGDHSVFQAADLATRIHNIFEIVYEKALDELDFYLNFLLIEKHPVISSLLLSLANLSKDFLFEVKLGYLELQSRMEMSKPEEIVEHFLSLERQYN